MARLPPILTGAIESKDQAFFSALALLIEFLAHRIKDKAAPLLENMLAHLMFGHVRDMIYLLGEIRTNDVGTCLDTGHAHLAREMGMAIQKLSSHLKMAHVNDNHGDRDEHLAPGQGSIDWPRVIRELRWVRFQGVLVLELSSTEHEPVEAFLARAVQAREFMKKLLVTP